ncbi:hypothetical protein [Amycolatopsis jiangsuensis]|uniref:Uncharacterized protein n=1 Tax=Amycolatopsis jiangsuensis TaxID=1181879 RepID=A0A840J168_9PSEU|nr:hypothetical protein [Amycolatopsis jiangsuensis]MBB4687227.1 hypothetical protein [Amycolatopsis jiangsuensis]
MTTRHAHTRTDAAIQWIVWHAAELAAVAAPLVLAALVSGWFALGTVVAVVAWAGHEIAVRRRHRGPENGAPHQITTTDTTSLPALPAGSRELKEGA